MEKSHDSAQKSLLMSPKYHRQPNNQKSMSLRHEFYSLWFKVIHLEFITRVTIATDSNYAYDLENLSGSRSLLFQDSTFAELCIVAHQLLTHLVPVY